jgi:hypothetical protein
MEQFFILFLVGFTSVGAFVVGARVLGLRGRDFRKATVKMVESFGISVAFFLVNLSAGVIVILAVRALTHGFLSLYVVNDAALLVLSLLQGLTFQCWRELSQP